MMFGPESPLTDGQQVVARYGVVSAINIVGHQLMLFLANSVWGVPGGWANALAATLMCIPAYLLSRNWVWAVDGAHSISEHLLPFWVITIVGLLVSTGMAAGAEALFGAGLIVNAAAFAGYFIVWVAKFLILNRLFARV